MQRLDKINAPLDLGATLAKPLANPWRNRIMAELTLRPMSPKQFTQEVGGPDLEVVARYFRELKDWELLEVVAELRGGGRRGAVEKIYQAAQRIYFDTPTWESLPYYLRCECSISMMEGFITRVTEAVGAGTFDSEKDRHLSWKSIRLDRQAWAEYSRALDAVLAELDEFETQSSERIEEEDASSFLVTVALLAFRMPPAAAEPRPGTPPHPNDEGLRFLMSPETAKALANPWRNRILAELHRRPMSPKLFVAEVGGPDISTIARHFRQLHEWGYLQIVEELSGGQRRGSVEKVYRGVRRAHFTTPTWEQLPLEVRATCSVSMLDGLIDRINEAVAADTFDAETDRFLCWQTARFDRRSWKEFGSRLDETLALVERLERESEKRLVAGAEEVPAAIALLMFPSPDPSLPAI